MALIEHYCQQPALVVSSAVLIFSSLRSECRACATLMLILGCGRTELIDLGGNRMVATSDVKIPLGDVYKIERRISVEAARGELRSGTEKNKLGR